MTTDFTSEYKALRAAAEAEGKKTRLSLSYTGEPEEETERRLRAVFPLREYAILTEVQGIVQRSVQAGKYIRVGDNIAFGTNDGRWNFGDVTRYEKIELYEVDDDGEVIDLIRLFGVVEV